MFSEVAYPLDVIRRRMQTAGHANIPQIDLKHNTLSLGADIIKKEGVKALFKVLITSALPYTNNICRA